MKKRIFTGFLIVAAMIMGTPIIMPQQELIITVEAKSKIKLNVTKKTIYKGKTYTLKVKGTKKKVKWSSSKRSVAKVSSKGKVTARKNGTAYIYARVAGKKLKCKITVKTFDKKVTKVTSVRYKKYIRGQYRESCTVRGLNKSGQTVWKYTTPLFPETELNNTKCITKETRVYVFEGSTLKVLNKATGKKLWSLKNIPTGEPLTIFDNNGNLYTIGYYQNVMYKISAKGKVIWKTSLKNTKNSGPYQLKCKNNKIYIYYEMGQNDSYDTHLIILYMSTGNIYSSH